ncbi:carboxypeptidase-like regulatory domain-containing protein [Laceyella putida]|uniref:Carboxypeptidase-like regulatory domain-containing protein n=1 Tax=Laceyella putida TaxID=110101 RepID=A0ABW2RPH5_9BACL
MDKRLVMLYFLIIPMIVLTSILVQGILESFREVSRFAVARGVVTDTTGKPMREVSVEIVPVGQKNSRNYIRLSDRNGRWHWEVPPGVYNIHLRKKGFRPHNIDSVKIGPKNVLTWKTALTPWKGKAVMRKGDSSWEH